MVKRPKRVILDTNIWISFLISNQQKKLDKLLFDDGITVLFSQELLEEFLEVTERPKLKKYFTSADVYNLLNVLNTKISFIVVHTKVNVCRDAKDNFLLSLAVDGKADYLITGDKDLLDLHNIKSTSIITLTEFLSKF